MTNNGEEIVGLKNHRGKYTSEEDTGLRDKNFQNVNAEDLGSSP